MGRSLPTPRAISETDPSPAALSPVRAVVRLDHLRHNVRCLQKRAGQAEIMGVVKANAYGHGAVRIAEVLHEEGVRHFAVARLAEALELRSAGLTGDILVLGAPFPHHLPKYAAHRLGVTVSSRDVAEAVLDVATGDAPLCVHVNVDTGMGRLGLSPDEAVQIADRLQQAPDVDLAGLWTHLATAERANDAFARAQLDRFASVVRGVGGTVRYVHTGNSNALLNGHVGVRTSGSALVRLGIGLYGLAARPALAAQADLRPVMQLATQVVHLKTVPAGTSISYGRRWRSERRTRIATLGAGYADGYARLLTNRAEVGLQGQRVPVVGTICMDMCMVDIGPPETGLDVAVGDTAVLFGPGGPSAFEVADWAETIPYEVCCGVAERVPRIYTEGD